MRRRWRSSRPRRTVSRRLSRRRPRRRPAQGAAAASAGSSEQKSHWWSFNEGEFLSGLGVDPENGLFGLGIWRTIVDLRAIGNLQNTKNPELPDAKFYSYLTDEGITMRNDGWYVLDPRLLTGSASVRVGWQQARQDAGNQGTGQDAGVTDYYFNLSVLPEKPYNAMLQASHAEYVTSHAGGGTTASSHTLQGATLSWREASILRDKEIAPYFSASLFGGHEDLQENTTNAGQQFLRDEQRDRVQFDAHNGFETGDLTLNLEQVDLTNKIFAEGSYRSRSADVSYSLDFGKDLTKHSDAHVHYNERTGDFGEEIARSRRAPVLRAQRIPVEQRLLPAAGRRQRGRYVDGATHRCERPILPVPERLDQSRRVRQPRRVRYGHHRRARRVRRADLQSLAAGGRCAGDIGEREFADQRQPAVVRQRARRRREVPGAAGTRRRRRHPAQRDGCRGEHHRRRRRPRWAHDCRLQWVSTTKSTSKAIARASCRSRRAR